MNKFTIKHIIEELEQAIKDGRGNETYQLVFKNYISQWDSVNEAFEKMKVLQDFNTDEYTLGYIENNVICPIKLEER